jgi:hypothetical protein
MRIIFILFAALALAASYSSEAAVVSTSEDVQKALLAAKGGETISLKPGTYGALTIRRTRRSSRSKCCFAISRTSSSATCTSRRVPGPSRGRR